ncbi:MAG: DUF6134 family protein [Pseudomonadota bacterium]
MTHKLLGITLLWVTCSMVSTSTNALEYSGPVDHLNFNVYFNDKRIGEHTFTFSQADSVTRVQSEASFNYKILFITAFRYEHSAAERWRNNCLTQIEARTNSNGNRVQLSGERSTAGFMLDTGDQETELPDCVMTFAYWNPRLLDQSRLLNPQTGEYVDVEVVAMGEETLQMDGKDLPAKRYRIIADDADISLWYSLEYEWLALESVAKGKHLIRYERT